MELVATPTGRALIFTSDMLDVQEVSGFSQDAITTLDQQMKGHGWGARGRNNEPPPVAGTKVDQEGIMERPSSEGSAAHVLSMPTVVSSLHFGHVQVNEYTMGLTMPVDEIRRWLGCVHGSLTLMK